jgi:hypothetical protein
MAQRTERIGIGQQMQRAGRQIGAVGQRLDRDEGRVAAHAGDGFCPVLPETVDLAQAQPQHPRAFQRIVPRARAHVDRVDGDAVFPRIAHDLRGGIEAHRLAVEQRAGEDRRIVAFQPGGHIGERGEGLRVAFRKAVVAEALDLFEAAFGEIAFVAAPDHAFDQLLLVVVDRAVAAERGHGAAQAIGFGGENPAATMASFIACS